MRKVFEVIYFHFTPKIQQKVKGMNENRISKRDA